ncbi:MAG TPA: hypothetical protein VHD63_09335 [Ktedonobacteraceae bacterium]|nr:hypothetical protein [Ktedonobacteraceae bacterium]
MAANRVENARTLSQVPPCPVCQRTDQVQKMQTAWERGWVHTQVPPMSRRTQWWWLLVLLAVIVYGGANFYLFAQLGGGPGFGGWPLFWQIVEVVAIEVILVIGLIFSVLAFARLINSRRETSWQYPARGQEKKVWQNLYHCRRDNVVFDVQRQEILSQDELKRRLRVLPPESEHPTGEDSS